MTSTERDQLLIETNNDVKWLKENQAKHLNHHFQYSIVSWAALVGAIFAVIKDRLFS